MDVASVMIKRIQAVQMTDTVKKAADAMTTHSIGSVFVTNKGSPVGIITERDILKRVIAKNKHAASVPCKTIMSKPILAIDAGDTIDHAVALMSKENIKRLAVTRRGSLVGIITAMDILNASEAIEGIALKKLAILLALPRQKTTDAN